MTTATRQRDTVFCVGVPQDATAGQILVFSYCRDGGVKRLSLRDKNTNSVVCVPRDNNIYKYMHIRVAAAPAHPSQGLHDTHCDKLRSARVSAPRQVTKENLHVDKGRKGSDGMRRFIQWLQRSMTSLMQG